MTWTIDYYNQSVYEEAKALPKLINAKFEQRACAIPFLSGAGQASHRLLADIFFDWLICFSLGGLR
jgi:hypothetical protein